MLIEKAEIERVKRANDLVALVRGRGIVLKRKGKQLVGKCPFHADHEPSFTVDPKKQLWNCLGACREGGDVYKFVMKLDGLDFRSAHLRLGGRDVPTPGGNGVRSSKPEEAKPDPAWLQTVVEHYHQTLLKTPPALDYLASRGLGSPELVTAFKIGCADGSLLELLSAETKQELTRLGVITAAGRELLDACVVFPLVAPGSGQVLSLYARSIQGRRHLYLPGERRGVFNPQGAQTGGEVILTESVIDAAALWAAGIRNAIPIYGINGLTEDILNHLEETRVRRVTLVLDSDDAGRSAAKRLSERLAAHFEIRSVELDAKDPAEFLAAGGSVDEIRDRIREAWQPAQTTPTARPESDDSHLGVQRREGALVLAAADREYRVRGLGLVGLERLRVNLRVKAEKGFHLDTLDLYQARSRASFAQAASTATGLPEGRIAKDLLELVDRLEEERLRMRNEDRQPEKEATATMTDQERREALEFLRSPDLIERIAADFEAAGLVGERAGALVAYLAAVSRKLTKPLSVLIVARTGAGKSSLQDALCSLLPPEEVVRVTRLTGQALFYKDPDSLKSKVLAIAEEEGAAQAVYSLRTLASDQWLSIAATRTDPQTGKLHTEHYEIHGPVSIVITTTSPEAFDEETRSRFIPLTLNESVEQTRAILARQRARHTLDGALAEAGAENVRKRHHHAQRLLRPLRVVNPYVDRLTYPEDRLIARREQEKYLTLINVIAFLRQYRKEVKRASREDVSIEYVEVGPEDIALANELAREVLWRGWDELAPPVRGMKRELEKLYARRAGEQGIEPASVGMTRREIREATGWSDWQVRMYCQRLVEMEYLILAGNGNGRPCQYYLARPEEADEPRLTGLVDVAPKAAAKEKTPEGH